MNPGIHRFLLFAALLLASAIRAEGLDPERLGLTAEKQSIHYWLEQAAKDGSIPFQQALLSPAQIGNLNRKLQETEPTYTDVLALPDVMTADQVKDRIGRVSKRPAQTLYDGKGTVLSDSKIYGLIRNLNLRGLRENSPVEFGLVTRRSALRAFPTDLRVFNQPGDTDIDRFQESALFPGTPVAVLHRSKDRQWLFVVSELYGAWMRYDAVALGRRSEVAAYRESQPRLVITDARARTAFTPERPEVSELALDMGISLPWFDQWPLTEAVNGQGPLGSHVVSLPTRGIDGRIALVPALVPNHYRFSKRYLDLSIMQLLLQSAQFIGERYGWGHDYGARDCSGFVSEIYRSMGIMLPRNTGDQARSTAFDREPFDAGLPREQRIERLEQLQIGDLVYIPGHVMMVIGHDQYGPWVIHDSHGTGFLQDGRFYPVPSNDVAITPLLSMALGADKTYIDAITGIQHIIPRNQSELKP